MDQRPKFKSKPDKAFRRNHKHTFSQSWIRQWFKMKPKVTKQQKEKKKPFIIKNFCFVPRIKKAKDNIQSEKFFLQIILSGKGGTCI